jgi:hypothetical protein
MTVSVGSHFAQTRIKTAPCSSTYVGEPSGPETKDSWQRAQRTDWWAAPRSAARQLADWTMSCHCETRGFFGFTRLRGCERIVVQDHRRVQLARSAEKQEAGAVTSRMESQGAGTLVSKIEREYRIVT